MKLHLGCGPVRLDGWLNIDLDSPVADVRRDLTEPLPLESGCATHVFSEHFIEHLTRHDAVRLLRECHRLLAEDGVLRISTPDLRVLATAYLKGELDGWAPLWRPATACLLMNEGMRAWGHQFVYDAEELLRLLAEAGFENVVFVDWRHSEIESLRGLESRPYHGELIVEATKSRAVRQADAGARHAAVQPAPAPPPPGPVPAALDETVRVDLLCDAVKALGQELRGVLDRLDRLEAAPTSLRRF